MPIDLSEVARTVVRIPVAGPSPNNTLVFVTSRLTGLIPEVSASDWATAQVAFLTAYEIIGFDQSRAADYLEHTKFSVAMTMNFLGTEDDQTFDVSIDKIEGHIASDGKIYATAEVYGKIDGETLTVNFGMSAYILTQEPQPDFSRPPRLGPTIRDRIEKHGRYQELHGFQARSISAEQAAGLVAPRKLRRIIDDCR